MLFAGRMAALLLLRKNIGLLTPLSALSLEVGC